MILSRPSLKLFTIESQSTLHGSLYHSFWSSLLWMQLDSHSSIELTWKEKILLLAVIKPTVLSSLLALCLLPSFSLLVVWLPRDKLMISQVTVLPSKSTRTLLTLLFLLLFPCFKQLKWSNLINLTAQSPILLLDYSIQLVSLTLPVRILSLTAILTLARKCLRSITLYGP